MSNQWGQMWAGADESAAGRRERGRFAGGLFIAGSLVAAVAMLAVPGIGAVCQGIVLTLAAICAGAGVAQFRFADKISANGMHAITAGATLAIAAAPAAAGHDRATAWLAVLCVWAAVLPPCTFLPAPWRPMWCGSR